MKVALTGSGGMLGHDIRRAFTDVELINFTREACDITNLDATAAAIRATRPDFLIHAAAFTNVDQCELEPERAYLVNGLGARNVTMACEEIRCPVIYLSSDYVFDGSKVTSYREWDQGNPINTYGLSKWLGERFVSSLTNRFYIVRTSWLFGWSGNNFVETILRLLAEREGIDVVDDQVGCPTFTLDLAETLRKLLGRGYGIYHVTNSGSSSWYGFATAIAEKRGIRKEIRPITSERLNRPAKRPAHSVLGNTMLALEGISPLRPWSEALDAYLAR